ncbi:MAG: hypothetical protein FWF12_08575 [Betaproteobacteria bacterium]|nr:hypothetical protein [Betaproteobacteria bacterium]
MSDQLKSNQNGKPKEMPWKEKPMTREEYLRIDKKIIWMFALFFTFLFFIPGYYTVSTKIPPFEELQLATGVFSYKGKGGKGGYTIILNKDKKNYYTCRLPSIDDNDCIWEGNKTKHKLDSLVGKTANIWWFEQKTYLWATQRRLMRLVVDGHEEYSYAQAVREINIGKNNLFFPFVLPAIVLIGLLIFSKRQIKEGSKHGTIES